MIKVNKINADHPVVQIYPISIKLDPIKRSGTDVD